MMYRSRTKIIIQILEKIAEGHENLPSNIALAVNLSYNSFKDKIKRLEEAGLLERIPVQKKVHWKTNYKLRILPKGMDLIHSYRNLSDMADAITR